MKLAFISYEYPPDTSFGGIGTYVYMISCAMRRMGHEVEVFSASKTRNSLCETFEEGVIVHRVKCSNRKKFPLLVAEVFAARHKEIQFDLAESPEFDADGRVIRSQFPQLVMAVKFHTPKFLVQTLNESARGKSWLTSLKKMFSAPYVKEKDHEYLLAMSADDLSSPSLSLKHIISERWNIPAARIRHHPYVYLPKETFLQIPADTNTRRVTFIGRLEIRKGVLALAKAIPLVLQKYPDVHFRFIGKADSAPDGRSMDVYLKEELSAYSAQLEFIPRVPPEQIPLLIAETDICVYPSLWENFPNVCLEAMSAARGIIASRNSGMLDMLEDINGGILIDPNSPQEIANGICRMLEFPEERKAMGERCRKKILDYYSSALLTETSQAYEQIIKIKERLKRKSDAP